MKVVQLRIEDIMDHLKRYVDDHLPSIWCVQDHALNSCEPKVKLVKCGSFYNQTKIGKPCEMDFALVFDKNVFSHFQERVSNNIPKRMLRHSVFTTPLLENMDYIFKTIRSLCSDCIRSMTFSSQSGWAHGGWDAPNFSGFRENGSASMMQFTYTDPENIEDKLRITVDLVLAIEVPYLEYYKWDPEFTPGEIYTHRLCDHIIFLKLLDYSDNVWMLLTKPKRPCQYTNSPATTKWLETFGKCSPVKRILRILKYMNSFGAPHIECYPRERSESEDTKTYFDSHSVFLLKLYDLNRDNPYLSTIGEEYPSLQYFSSFVLQSLVIFLFSACPAARPGVTDSAIWRMEDIPRVLATILDILCSCVYIIADANDHIVEMILEIHIDGEWYVSELIPDKLLNYSLKGSSVLQHVKGMITKLQQLAGVEVATDGQYCRYEIIRQNGKNRRITVIYDCILLNF